MEQIVNEVPLFVWGIIGVFFAFIAYRVYKSNTRPKSTGTGGVRDGGKTRQK